MIKYVMKNIFISNFVWLTYLFIASEAQAGFVSDNALSYVLAVDTRSGVLESKIRVDSPENVFSIVSDVVQVSNLDFAVHEFELARAGTYTASLRDFEFPNSLESLELNIYSAGSTPGMTTITLSQNGTLTFEAEAGSYFATLSAFASDNGLSRFGLYGFEITAITAVPLPAAIVFFLSGLMMFGFSMRHNEQ